MGKSKYHHGDLRRALVEAAFDLAVEHGPDGVSMREAARTAGVSTAAPYRHFKDRDELMSAVAAKGYERLLDGMKASAEQSGQSPLLQYRAYGVHYVTFAVNNPNLFRIMHVARWSDPSASPEMAAAHANGEGAIMTLVDKAGQEGEMAQEAPRLQHLASHALVYGLARLYVDGQWEGFGLASLEVQPVVEAVMDIFGQGLIPR